MNPRHFILPALLALALGWIVLGYRPTDPPLAATGTGVELGEAGVGGGGFDFGADVIDSLRLLTDLSVLAHDSMAGRAPGSEGSRSARGYIVRSLEAAGATPFDGGFEHTFELNSPEEGTRTGTNVVARLPGTGGPHVIVLSAHYDHLGVRDGEIFNGTDDNASGTAAVLEIARQVSSDPLGATLVLALLDAEESGLQGARAFVAAPPVPIADITLNVNLDMVSRSGGLLWASGAHHTPALRAPLEAVAASAPVRLRLGHDRPNAPEGDDWTSASDHGPFHAAGIPFVYFGVEDHPDYHRSTDDFENVVAADYVNSVRTILAALRALDATLPLPTPASPE